MSIWVTGGVAFVYVAGALGLHRLNVWRRRAKAGMASLRWLDWDALFRGLVRPAPRPGGRRLSSGQPAPASLGDTVNARVRVLAAIAEGGEAVQEGGIAAAGFSGGEVGWVTTLALAASRPEAALERLEATEPTSAAEVYLREWLCLTRAATWVNLELAVWGSKRRLSKALLRFGDEPSLYFVRALASSLVGFNQSAIDDLARAVYFSRLDPFYLWAVLECAYIDDVRPALVQQCRLALDPDAGVE